MLAIDLAKSKVGSVKQFLILFAIAIGCCLYAQTNSVSYRLRKLANELEPPPPLPESPAHARQVYEHQAIDLSHPSGLRLKFWPPTNTVTLPGEGTLTNRPLSDISLEEFSDMRRTNGGLRIWYFVPQ